MSAAALELTNYGVSLSRRVILVSVDFTVPARGMTVLLGPAGSGKSTLLRTLAGLNDSHPSLLTWGGLRIAGHEAELAGGRHVIEQERRPRLVVQLARFFLDSVRENIVSSLPNRAELEPSDQTKHVVRLLCENGFPELADQLESDAGSLPLRLQRALAVLRHVAADPALLFVDEPTAGLDHGDAEAIIGLLRAQAERRSVVFVTHNQAHARSAGGRTALLAGGQIQEHSDTADFFDRPSTELGHQFLRSGSCATASPESQREDLQPGMEPTPRPPAAVRLRLSDAPSPRSFFWVVPNRLGGLPRPGLLDSLAGDLRGLKRLGVTVLVTLEEETTVPSLDLHRFGLTGYHCPMADMGVPTLDAAADLCRRIEEWLRGNDVVAMHCRAGLGRTGTLLACQLIWAGKSPQSALEHMRLINPRCVQSDAQESFLGTFARHAQLLRAAAQA